MTAAALAERAEIRPDLLAEVEGGNHEPSVSTLRRIASALGVSLDDLAG